MQKVTSQLQLMQEQNHSMNDSVDFQDVESNHSGRLSLLESKFSFHAGQRQKNAA